MVEKKHESEKKHFVSNLIFLVNFFKESLNMKITQKHTAKQCKKKLTLYKIDIKEHTICIIRLKPKNIVNILLKNIGKVEVCHLSRINLLP